MAFDFDKFREATLKAAQSAKKSATELADKGKKQVDLVNLQNKLSKAQKQLGALVYSLHVNGDENQPLIEKYIEEIAAIEAEIAALSSDEGKVESVEEKFEEVSQPEESEKKFCGQCGGEVDKDALFCNHCGAQL